MSQRAMTSLGVIPAFDPGEHCQAGFSTSFEGFAINEFALQAGEEALAMALSYASPTVPMEGCTPIWRQQLPKARLVYWANSTGRRNILNKDVTMKVRIPANVTAHSD